MPANRLRTGDRLEQVLPREDLSGKNAVREDNLLRVLARSFSGRCAALWPDGRSPIVDAVDGEPAIRLPKAGPSADEPIDRGDRIARRVTSSVQAWKQVDRF